MHFPKNRFYEKQFIPAKNIHKQHSRRGRLKIVVLFRETSVYLFIS